MSHESVIFDLFGTDIANDKIGSILAVLKEGVIVDLALGFRFLLSIYPASIARNSESVVFDLDRSNPVLNPRRNAKVMLNVLGDRFNLALNRVNLALNDRRVSSLDADDGSFGRSRSRSRNFVFLEQGGVRQGLKLG